MGLQRFQPARRASGPPEIAEFDIQASATFPAGAPVQRDTVESDIEEAAGGATVDGIIGIGMFGVTAGLPAPKGSTGFGTRVLVAIANHDQEFWGMLSDGTDVQVPDSGNEGTDYGIVKVSGEWYVDESDISDVVLTVTKSFPDNRTLLFKFLASAVSF